MQNKKEYISFGLMFMAVVVIFIASTFVYQDVFPCTVTEPYKRAHYEYEGFVFLEYCASIERNLTACYECGIDSSQDAICLAKLPLLNSVTYCLPKGKHVFLINVELFNLVLFLNLLIFLSYVIGVVSIVIHMHHKRLQQSLN